MTCPDWRALVAARDAEPAADPLTWSQARRHAAECSRCRGEALAADPLLLFARLPERTVAPQEITAMQAGVASLIRAGRVVEVRLPEGSDARSLRERAFRRIAAVLGVCSLLALSGAPRTRSAGPGDFAGVGGIDGLGVALEAQVEGAPPLPSVVEELYRPGARIYELPQAGMAVVMIVDASLDV